MIKSAPSAASILTKMQVDPACPSFVRSGRLWAPQTLVVQVAAPAADLSTWLIFKHLKQNLASGLAHCVGKSCSRQNLLTAVARLIWKDGALNLQVFLSLPRLQCMVEAMDCME